MERIRTKKTHVVGTNKSTIQEGPQCEDAEVLSGTKAANTSTNIHAEGEESDFEMREPIPNIK